MNKEEFLEILKKRLSYLNQTELKKQLDFYEEAINDRIDEGMDEFQAVKDLGAISDIVNLINTDYPNNSTVIKDDIKSDDVENKEEVESNVKENKNSTIASILLIPVVIFIICLIFALCITSFTFIITGVIVFLSTFSVLNSPFSTIIFNFGIGLLLFGLGILLIPICKYCAVYSKLGYQKIVVYIKERI